MAKRPTNKYNVRRAPQRQVVASPIDTTVAPGGVQPEEPAPIPLPTPPQETDINVAEMAARRDAANAIREQNRWIDAYSSVSQGARDLSVGVTKLAIANKRAEDLTLDYQIRERNEILAQLAIDNLSFAEREEQGLIPPNANPNYMRALAEYEVTKSQQGIRERYVQDLPSIQADPANDTLSGFQDNWFEEQFNAAYEAMPKTGDKSWYHMRMGQLKNQIWDSISKSHYDHVVKKHKEKERSFINTTALDVLEDTISNLQPNFVELEGQNPEVVYEREFKNALGKLEFYMSQGWGQSRTPGYMARAFGKALVDIQVKSSDPKIIALAGQVYKSLTTGEDNALVSEIKEVKNYAFENERAIAANNGRRLSATAKANFNTDKLNIENSVESAIGLRLEERLYVPDSDFEGPVRSDISDLRRKINPYKFTELVDDEEFIASVIPEGYELASSIDQETGIVKIASLDPNLQGEKNTFELNLKKMHRELSQTTALKYARDVENLFNEAFPENSPIRNEAMARAHANKIYQVEDTALKTDLNNLKNLINPVTVEDNPEAARDEFEKLYEYVKAYRDEDYDIDMDEEALIIFDTYEHLLYDLGTGQGSDNSESAFKRVSKASTLIYEHGTELRKDITTAYKALADNPAELKEEYRETGAYLGTLGFEEKQFILKKSLYSLASGETSSGLAAVNAAALTLKNHSTQISGKHYFNQDLIKFGYTSAEDRSNIAAAIGPEDGLGPLNTVFQTGLPNVGRERLSLILNGQRYSSLTPRRKAAIDAAVDLIPTINEQVIFPVMVAAAEQDDVRGLGWEFTNDGKLQPLLILGSGSKILIDEMEPLDLKVVGIINKIWTDHLVNKEDTFIDDLPLGKYIMGAGRAVLSDEVAGTVSSLDQMSIRETLRSKMSDPNSPVVQGLRRRFDEFEQTPLGRFEMIAEFVLFKGRSRLGRRMAASQEAEQRALIQERTENMSLDQFVKELDVNVSDLFNETLTTEQQEKVKQAIGERGLFTSDVSQEDLQNTINEILQEESQ